VPAARRRRREASSTVQAAHLVAPAWELGAAMASYLAVEC